MPKKKKTTEETTIEAPVATHVARFFSFDSGLLHRTGNGYTPRDTQQGTLEQVTTKALEFIKKAGQLWYTVHITPVQGNTGYNSFMRKVFFSGTTQSVITQDIVAAVVADEPLKTEEPAVEAETVSA